uniref:Uncharacterized protein n=1 Tax=Cyprinus carpio carpio TaxID=630221 RepID=A0A9J7X9K2_CYPCA
MKHVFIFLLLCLREHGVFGVDKSRVTVMEGDSVTLHTDVKVTRQTTIKWHFKNNLIAEITGALSFSCTDVQCNNGTERFKDRLKLDHQTGSLTITNITNTDSGVYTVDISSRRGQIKIFVVAVRDASAFQRDRMRRKSVMEGESVTLNSHVTNKQKDLMMWYFNDTLIAEITGDQSKICTDDQCEERFRDRLKLDHQTGSLTITHIKTTEAGEYKLQIMSSSRFSIMMSFSVTVTGIYSVGSDEVSVFVLEGDSVTLQTYVKTNQQEKIRWYFNGIQIAEITGDLKHICTDVQCKDSDGKFRDRLNLDHQTGSLTITNIKRTDYGLSELQVTHKRGRVSRKIFIVAVYGFSGVGSDGVSAFVMEEDSVTLYIDAKTNKSEGINWNFNFAVIAEISGDLSDFCTDVQCFDYGTERFKDRLKLDHQTGSLTITNIRTTDSGDYYLRTGRGLRRARASDYLYRDPDSISVSVYDVPAAQRDQMKRKSVMEGESVTLDTGFIKNPNDLMTWYFNDILIAEITGDQSKICTDYECDERFRDRLKVNQQTGSLTIMNTRSTDSGLYELQINSSRISIIRRFSVTLFYGGSVSVKEGDSVTLPTDVKTNLQEKIRWYFNDFQIAEITGDLRHICTDVQCKDSDERFRDRLKLDNQTGSLTIMNIRTTDSGLYHLQISSIRGKISTKIFMVAVYGFSGVGSDGVSAFVMEEDSVTLYTDVETNQQKGVRWYFQYTFIAEISGDLSYICTDVQCDDSNERFRDRLKLDHQTGSLTIRNIKQTDHGIYELHIISSRRESNHQNFNRRVSEKTFGISVHNVSAAERDEMKRKSAKEGESVTLNSHVTNKQKDLMMWYFNDTLIAEITGDQSKICTDDQCEERFRDRLKLDHQTGSLTITNITNTDSGEYKLQINSSKISIIRSFSVNLSAAVAGIYASVSVVLLLLVASAGLIYSCKFCSRRNYIRRQHNDQVNVDEGSSPDQTDSLLMTPATDATDETPQ